MDTNFHFSEIKAQFLGHMEIARLVFWETVKWFFRVAVPFIFPPAKYEWSSFSAFSMVFCSITFLNFRHSYSSIVIFHCGLIGISLMAGEAEHLLVCFIAMSVYIVCQFSNWIFFWLVSLYLLATNLLLDMWFGNVLSVCCLYMHSLHRGIYLAQLFLFFLA